MNLKPIFQVLWARRIIVLAATLSSLAGGLGVVTFSSPRYQANARVLLDYIKPDPVTGAQVPTKMATAYVNSQIEFVRDYQVAIPAAEALGMLDNPDLAETYAAMPGEKPDYRMWVAQHLMGALNAVPIEDSSIIEIRFRAADPQYAVTVAEAIRQAYVDASVEQRRDASQASADRLLAQAAKVQEEVAALQAKQQEIEKQSGIVLQGSKRDLDQRVLRTLEHGVDSKRNLMPESVTAAPSGPRLAQVEASLAMASQSFGPNHPTVRALTAERARLKAQVALETNYASSLGVAVATRTRLMGQLLEQQKTKILNQRPTMIQLRLLQDEIDAKLARANELIKRAAELRQVATSKETSFTPIGAATALPHPVFPNPWLIIPGTTVLGLITGVLLALLAELSGRRLRNPDDMANAIGAPVIAEVPLARRRQRSGRLTAPLAEGLTLVTKRAA
jgi:uncharacterized protein involved in exopolysaccharide biosynthesis